jgi:DNA ligase-4
VVEAIASRVRFSSPSVRARSSSYAKPGAGSLSLEEALGPLQDMYRRLTARDAKWLTRLLLKSYEPVMVDHTVVYEAFHPLLPFVMNVYDHFALAGATLQRLDHECREPQSRVGDEAVMRDALMRHLMPVLGVKVGRQPWLQGRSIKHCLNMGQGLMSCEEKLDGEYCQIHIDLSKGRDCIQIFSKSGKDSTQDRKALHKYAGALALLLAPSILTSR